MYEIGNETADILEKVFEGLDKLKNYEYDIDFVSNPTFKLH